METMGQTDFAHELGDLGQTDFARPKSHFGSQWHFRTWWTCMSSTSEISFWVPMALSDVVDTHVLHVRNLILGANSTFGRG